MVESALLIAVIVTFRALGTLPGAVYNPSTMLPRLGLSDQVTEVSEDPVTVTLYCLA